MAVTLPDRAEPPRRAGYRFAVAPMMDWTDRHCRLFHRQLTRRATLFTEMVTAPAIVHGDRARLLEFCADEHPVIQQIGGSDPAQLAEAARIVADFGYDGIDLNCGCPSDRVQSGTFGACLMADPDVVARGVAAMKAAVSVPVSVKCRIGIDDQTPEETLPRFLQAVINAGADAITIHARKAWLKGLSPKENREIPPLDYPLVHAMKARFPAVPMGINGGIRSLDASIDHLRVMDGVMLGRAAYETPALLADVDRDIYGDAAPPLEMAGVIAAMTDHAARHIADGGKLHHVTRHMLGLFAGRPGARLWRRMLSTEAAVPGADAGLIDRAFAAVQRAADGLLAQGERAAFYEEG